MRAVVAVLVALVVLLLVARACRGPDAVVFGAGGDMGAAHVGFVLFMEERGLLPVQFAGSSVGAVVAAGCAMRMDARAMAREWHALDYAALVAGGAPGGDTMLRYFRLMVERHTGSADTTFAELHRLTGATLVVAVTCVSLRTCVYFTHTDPAYADVAVALALRMSCSLPTMEPVWHRGVLYEDGGVAEALPLAAFGAGNVIGVRLLKGACESPNVACVSTGIDRDPTELMRRGYEAARAFFMVAC